MGQSASADRNSWPAPSSICDFGDHADVWQLMIYIVLTLSCYNRWDVKD